MDRNDALAGGAGEDGASHRLYYGWMVLAGCTVLSVLSGAFFYSRAVFLPEFSHAFKVGRLEISLAFTCAQVSGALCAPFIGRALDRYSPRRILAICAVLLALGYILSSQVPRLWMLYASFGLLSGIGFTGISNFGSGRILVEWFRRRVGFVLAVDSLGASLAGVAVAPLAILLISLWGWRLAYGSFGLFTLALALPLLGFVIRSRPSDIGLKIDDGVQAPSYEPATETPWPTLRILALPDFWGLVVIFGVMGCVWSGLNLHLFGHLRGMGLRPGQAASVLSVEAAFTALAKPFIGGLADLIGIRKTILLSLAAQLIGVTSFAAGQGLAVALPSAAIYGCGLSGLVALQATAAAKSFGRRSYGSAVGLLQLAILPISLTSSPLAGYIYDVYGSYRRAFWCYAALLLVAAPAILLLRTVRPSAIGLEP